MLREKALPAAKKELEVLTEFAKSNGFDGESLALWDVPYWSERQSEKLFGFEEEELRPYFALPNVLSGLFGLCSRIFDVRGSPDLLRMKRCFDQRESARTHTAASPLLF